MARRSGARRWGIRARTAWSATLVVALALLAASAVLVLLQRQQLAAGLTGAGIQQAKGIAEAIQDSDVSGDGLHRLLKSAGGSAPSQILDAQGGVLAATDDQWEQAVTTRAVAEGETVTYTVESLGEEAEPFVVTVVGVESGSELLRVVTAQPLEGVRQATSTLVTLLAFGLPPVLAVVAWASFAATGRALRPVEDIRKKVAGLSAPDRSARVPVPDTGDEIARLAETMNAMLARLEAAAVEQRRFVADASHELRTPLATIRATTELSGLHPEAEAPEHARAVVLAETARMERMVADLLLLARADERGLLLRQGDVDLDDIVGSEVARLRTAGGRVIEAEIHPVRVRGDAGHLLRAVRNLLDNAQRLSAGRVTIRLHVEGSFAVLDVIDDGPGIPEADRGRVFERFVRLDASRERGTGGSGLGLAITREIALAHGGDVQALPAPTPPGAHLRLTLPVPGVAQPPSGASR